jgi:Predicted membrane-bound metal-dependent hydrolases
MDPLTHTVIGLAVAKVTGNPVIMSEPATICIVAGSVFPDIDIMLQKWGDVMYLKNHRGVTHSIVGLLVSSALIAGVVSLVFGNTSFLNMFLWALLGCFSHAFFDTLNAFGAKLLWPILDKKYSLGVLITFDPVFIGLLAGYTFAGEVIGRYCMVVFLLYFASRGISKIFVIRELYKKYGNEFEHISLLPSMKGLFKWHFILEGKDYNVIGEKDVLRNRIRIVKKLKKIQDEKTRSVLFSAVGRFFSEFTPVFHIACEKDGGINRYIFIDMRYYLKNKFLHHAVLELDENNSVVKQTFNPYSMNRSCTLL